MISRVQRLLVPALLLVAMCCLAACSSGGGGPADAEFTPSASAPAAGLVRLGGANVDAQTVRVDVIIDGPLMAPELYSFAFDLLLSDPDAAQYVPGSAVLGDALVPSAGQGLGIAVSQPPGNRVVVGVTKTGGGTGNGLSSGEKLILSLEFNMPRAGATTLRFVGSPSNPQNPSDEPSALNAAGLPVSSVTFDSDTALIAR